MEVFTPDLTLPQLEQLGEVFLQPKQAMLMLGVKKTTFYERAATDPDWPKPIKSGGRTVAPLSRVRAYQKKVMAAAGLC